MAKKKLLNLGISEIAIILVNLIPIYGLIFYDWGLFLIVAFFATEIIAAGLIVFLKLLFLANYFPEKRTQFMQEIFITASAFSGIFFMCFIPFMAMFSTLPNGDGWTGMNMLSKYSRELIVFFVALFLRYLVSFFSNFVGKKEYMQFKDLSPNNRIFGEILAGKELASRIIVMIFGIYFGLFVVIITRAPTYLAIFFIAFKIIFELERHKMEHKNTAQRHSNFGQNY